MTRSGYPEGYIGQHTLYERQVMEARKTAKRWRNHPGMLIMMPESDERALHRELDGLPLPSFHLANRALKHLNLLPPDTFGRLEMFNSVTNLMHDIATRYSDNEHGLEAAIFAEHFENQRTFFGRALTKAEEDEFRATLK